MNSSAGLPYFLAAGGCKWFYYIITQVYQQICYHKQRYSDRVL